MAYIETFWMACDSTEQLRAEYGPFHGRAEAETEASGWVSAICCVMNMFFPTKTKFRKCVAFLSNCSYLL